ncbi:MAG TPA: hypothetical protein ENI23_03015 [bacterium]|nr:hypothetical protein [bacterium]
MDQKYIFNKQQKIIDDLKEEIRKLRKMERAWVMTLRGRYGWSEEVARLVVKQNIERWGEK